MASGEEDLVSSIYFCFSTDSPLAVALYDAARAYYRSYLMIGGMPDCVSKFIDTKDYLLVRPTQDIILKSALNDMNKYNTANEIKRNARAAEFENAVEWLTRSCIVTRIYRVEQIKKSLENYKNIDEFKIYCSDIGLLCTKKNIVPDDALYLCSEITVAIH